MMTRMRHDAPRGIFVGRRREQDRLAELLAAAREGRSGSVVLRAGPGLGKTYLLAALTDTCGDEIQVITVTGAEDEMAFDFAVLQRICAQLGGRVEALPDRQRQALRVAIGADAGDLPDPFLVGLAMVNVFSDAGATRPLLCVIDDAQWVDGASRQALGFAARRLLADRVVLVFATRETGGGDHLDGLPSLPLAPLRDGEARALLDAVLPGRLDHQVRERLLTEAAGSPLALVELPRALSPAELAGGFGLARRTSRRSPATSVEDAYAARYAALPEPTQLLLLIAAAEPVGDPTWLWAAADRLGVGIDAAGAAEAVGLVTVEARLAFRHPLVRVAVLRSADTAARQRVHAALAETIMGPEAADYRAWHRAHAVSAPDEATAAELFASAERAQRRGGRAAEAAFLDHGVDLTPDPTTRARRALDAAEAKLDSGDTQAAARLIETADATTVDAHHHARVALLRARLAFAGDRGREGPRLLLAAARALADHEPLVSRETYLEALMAAMIVGRLAGDVEYEPDRIAEAAGQAPSPPTPPRAVDRLLDGLVVRYRNGYAAAAPLLAEALDAYLGDMAAGTADPRWHDITNRICLDLFDFDAYRALAERQLALLREAGELTVLPAALTTMAAAHVLDGEFDAGQALLDEAFIVSTATGAPPHRSGIALLAAHRGDEAMWRSAAARTVDDAAERGEGTEVTVAWFSQAMLNNGLARYADAADACRTGRAYDDVGLYGCLLLEAAEAAAYTRDFAAAREVADELTRRGAASGTESALGLAARSSALAQGERATDNEYRTAIAHLERSPLAVFRARTHLVYGEWLRRAGRNDDARAQLRLAHDQCTGMGADGFAQRAARELQAAGGATSTRGQRYDLGLTTQERHISRLVRLGQTNAEIGAQLLISHRTVEWHLRNIYNKLGIASRRELRGMEV
jgi:DNA-binding CsgD family transcriptional regulator